MNILGNYSERIMRLVTVLKYIFIILVALIIFLGTPIIVGLFTLNKDALLISLFGGGFMSAVFIAYIAPVILKPTIDYWHKKEKEKEHE
jgi:hypothetical protein